ncbi:ribonuclease X25 [Oratosquilla oratoria]|uniref:ribonuclease X25 n=1 Tax=Oratosquilla oratoria TaxID=337810 RepID=UPI003F759BB7
MKFLAILAMVQSVLVFGRPGWKDVNWDVLIFTQQWPITSCIDHKARHSGAFCNLYPNMTSWTIHGVWPTKLGTMGPNYCNNSWNFNEHKIADIEPFLIKYWANIFAEDSTTSLWKHEWSKHGTCAAQLPALNSQLKYFKKGLQWVTQYDIVSALARHMIYPSDVTTYTVVAIADAIQDMFGTRPAVDCVFNKERHEHELSQIKVCFDKTLKLVHCDGIIGSSGQPVIGNCPQSKGIFYPGSVRLGDVKYSYPPELVEKHVELWEHAQASCISWLCHALMAVYSLMWITL